MASPTTGAAALSVLGTASAILKYVTTGTGTLVLSAAGTDSLRFPVSASGVTTLTATGATIGILTYAVTGAASISFIASAPASLITFGFTGWGLPI